MKTAKGPEKSTAIPLIAACGHDVTLTMPLGNPFVEQAIARWSGRPCKECRAIRHREHQEAGRRAKEERKAARKAASRRACLALLGIDEPTQAQLRSPHKFPRGSEITCERGEDGTWRGIAAADGLAVEADARSVISLMHALAYKWQVARLRRYQEAEIPTEESR